MMNVDRSSQAQLHFDLANAQLAAGLADDALQSIRRSLNLDPRNAAARLLEARAQLARNMPRRTLEALNRHDQLNPAAAGSIELRMLRAQALMMADKVDEARDQLDRLTIELPDDARAFHMRAILAAKHGQHDIAIENLKEVIRIEPDDSSSRQLLAHFVAGTQPQDAVDLLETFDPDRQSQSKLAAARLCHHTGRDAEARDYYQQLLRDHPYDHLVWFEAGKLAASLGNMEQAMLQLDRASTLCKHRNVPILEALATTYMDAGLFESAGLVWWRITRLERHHLNAVTGLLICAIVRERDGLIRRMRLAVERAAIEPERQAALAGHWARVAAACNLKSLQSPAGEQLSLSPLAALTKAAATALADHAKRFPHRADTHFHLAQCEQALGRTGAASLSAAKAVEINPNYVDALNLRVELMEKTAA